MIFNSVVNPFTHLDISSDHYKINFSMGGGILVDFNIEVEGCIRNFSLENGGWLPLGLTNSRNFYVDRNFLTALRSGQSKKYDINRWLSISGGVNFSPLLCAIEGRGRVVPSFIEFKDEFTKIVECYSGVSESINFVQASDEELRRSFQIIEEFKSKKEARENFLLDVLDKILCKVSAKGARRLADEIVNSAITHGLRKDPLVVLCALGCALESGNICGGLIKPGKIKSKKGNLHNFLSDIDNIYITMVSRCFLGNESYRLFTLDKSLAAFWSVLSPEEVSYSDGLLSFSYNKNAEANFFNKLNIEDREDVFSMCFGG